MYCPKCSQQQSSDEVRFCSRCGFQLGVVKELLSQTDAPAPTEAVLPAPSRALRKRDVTIGALVMYIIALIILLISPGIPPVRSEQIGVLTILFVALVLFINFISPLMRAAGKLFGEEEAASRKTRLSSPQAAPGLITQVSPSAHRSALPPSQGVPVAGFNSPRVNTAEMLQPSSITEHTTNLLNRD